LRFVRDELGGDAKTDAVEADVNAENDEANEGGGDEAASKNNVGGAAELIERMRCLRCCCVALSARSLFNEADSADVDALMDGGGLMDRVATIDDAPC
jgi:hypothetical protein